MTGENLRTLIAITKLVKGPLIIISGPSGSGKSTIVKHLLENDSVRLRLSVSATTRPPRPGEIEGREYYFWTREHFEEQIEAGCFLEWAEVFGNLYGTPKAEVEVYRDCGIAVLLEIDVQGAQQVLNTCPDSVSIFVCPPSLEELERRLRSRGTESEEVIQQRFEEAQREMQFADRYDYRVVNSDLQQTVDEISAIINSSY